MIKLSKAGKSFILFYLLGNFIGCLIWQATLFSEGNYWSDVVGSFMLNIILALIVAIFIAIKNPTFFKPFELEK